MDTEPDQRSVAFLGQWLRENESRVVPLWIAQLRTKGGLLHAGTRELGHPLLLAFYDRLAQVVVTRKSGNLEQMLRRLISDHARQNYDIRQILQFPMQLKSILWRLIFQEFSSDQAQDMVDRLDAVLDVSVQVLVDAHIQETETAVNAQLQELDFLTQRLAISSDETERAFTQLRSFYNISRALSSTLDIHDALQAVADNLVSLQAIERCTIWLSTSADTLQVGVTTGPGDSRIDNVTLSSMAPNCFVARALVTGERQALEDDGDVLGPFFVDRQVLALPMYHENRPVGVVMINSRAEGGPFSAATVDLVQAATEQAAVALENAQLYGRVMRFNQELEAKVQQRTAELEEINREMLRVNADLESLDKTKSDFISIAAHELKTPLTLVQGYANIMSDSSGVVGNPLLSNMLQGIVKGSERLHGIIESMIDVSMIDSHVMQLSPSRCSIGQLLRALADQYSQALEERQLALYLSDMGALPHIEADSQRLSQVFDNLIVNAIKYTPDGGQVEVTVDQMKGQDDDDWIEVIVSDTGIGIDPEHIDRIFDKFYQTGQVALHSTGRTKFKGGGPGLGLAIAKGIVEAHGGRIWAESEGYDEVRCLGSQFYVVFPVKSQIVVREIPSPFASARRERLG